MRFRRARIGFAMAILLGVGIAAAPEPLRVIATTTIVGDVVRSIAGDRIALHVLLPLDADPHAFYPTPSDVITVSRADIVFVSGAGLEHELDPLLADVSGEVIDLSQGLALRAIEGGADAEEGQHATGSEHGGGAPNVSGYDPHVWFDPANIILWADAIEEALSDLDPGNATTYSANAVAYRHALADLDRWIQEQVETVPPDGRILVTDHLSFAYFAARYGFDQVGAVFPGFSSLAEPSAREMAELIETILGLGVRAIFVGTTANPALAEAIAADAGVDVVLLYTGSLSARTGPASTYLDMMRYNVNAIVTALAD